MYIYTDNINKTGLNKACIIQRLEAIHFKDKSTLESY